MLKRYCDMCGKEMSAACWLTVEIVPSVTRHMEGQMRQKEICEGCAIKVREFIVDARGEKE